MLQKSNIWLHHTLSFTTFPQQTSDPCDYLYCTADRKTKQNKNNKIQGRDVTAHSCNYSVSWKMSHMEVFQGENGNSFIYCDDFTPISAAANLYPVEVDSSISIVTEGCVYVSSVTWSCPALYEPMDCSPAGPSAHGIFQARILDWDACFPPQGIFLTQGSNLCLLCLLHWQVDFLFIYFFNH